MLSRASSLYQGASRYYTTQVKNFLYTSSFTQSNRTVESSTLKNGMKVVSLQGGYSGPAVSLGLYINTGSRNETQETAGINQFLKNLVFQSNSQKIHLEVQREIESLGSSTFSQANRDSLLISAQTLPTQSRQMLHSLANLTNPALPYHEVRDMSEVVAEESEAYNHDVQSQLFESLHQQAYRGKTLGRPLVAPLCNISNISQDKVVSYVNQQFNPSNMVLVSVGINHNELVAEAEQVQFGVKSSDAGSIKVNKETSKYIGGESLSYASGNTHVVLGFEGSSSKNVKDVAALSVLQKLLGVGSSNTLTNGYIFGKTSRLSSIIANNSTLVQAESFNLTYADSGLFGLYVESESGDVNKTVSLLTSELVAASKASGEELSRAKALARSATLEVAEHRTDALEFVGKQALYSFDKLFTPAEFAEEINKVTSEDVKRVAKKMFSSKPTLVVKGDISNVPTLEEVAASLKL